MGIARRGGDCQKRKMSYEKLTFLYRLLRERFAQIALQSYCVQNVTNTGRMWQREFVVLAVEMYDCWRVEDLEQLSWKSEVVKWIVGFCWIVDGEGAQQMAYTTYNPGLIASSWSALLAEEIESDSGSAYIHWASQWWELLKVRHLLVHSRPHRRPFCKISALDINAESPLRGIIKNNFFHFSPI